ncbi:LacI family DNA-binding transcriptional regulator [Nocardioides sp. CER19]|uniref:LacI family DNA-binding transcriptional regulator n=1 Tax=Nocardioides sp. CER19 TaxID=3038538 RepID=UPI0024472FA6|nr:LacI family DNA-binding transcriptional regulator [Nocardioides sp. CER19]MDH2415156.1 LacI family DNA-binding transcriptional regulator [Nocardioides sp. CER19]
MPRRRVTIRDVARAAGVSTTTVSEALSGRGRTAEATRARVRDVAADIGYVASATARSLRLGRSGAVGLYVPDQTVGFEYYAQLSRGAAEAALGHGLALTLVPAWHDTELLRSLHIDGLIVSDPASDDPVLDVLRALPVPMVTVEDDPAPGAEPAGVVRGDHVAATRRLLDHLHDAGAASVAVLAPGAETAFGRQVRDGCAGVAGVRVVDIRLAWEPAEITARVDEALSEDPDALVVVPDGAVLVALHHLQGLGVRVPGDLLLASYVDAPSLETVRPPITAVDLDPRGTGAAAVGALVDAIAGRRTSSAATEVPARLRVRESTGAR